VGATRQTVMSWPARYDAGRVQALQDLARSERPAVPDEVAVAVATLKTRLSRLGVTHGSARLLGDRLVMSFATVRGSGVSGSRSPGGSRRSSTPPPPSLRSGSATVSGWIWPRPSTPSWSASMRSRVRHEALVLTVREEAPAAVHHSDRLTLEAGRSWVGGRSGSSIDKGGVRRYGRPFVPVSADGKA